MARKVDKKFVMMLGMCLAVGGVGAAGLVYYRRHRQQDPKLLEAQAIKAEKEGDIPSAVSFYERAAGAASQLRSPDAERLFEKLSELADAYASKAKTPDEGVVYAQKSFAALQRAQLKIRETFA